jgi:hypothetical protein
MGKLTKNNIELLKFICSKADRPVTIEYIFESLNTNISNLIHLLDDNGAYIESACGESFEINESVVYKIEELEHKHHHYQIRNIYIKSCNYKLLKQIYCALENFPKNVIFPIYYANIYDFNDIFDNIAFLAHSYPIVSNNNKNELNLSHFNPKKNIELRLDYINICKIDIGHASNIYIHSCGLLKNISILLVRDLHIGNINCGMQFISSIKGLENLHLEDVSIENIDFSALKCLRTLFLKEINCHSVDLSKLHHVDKIIISSCIIDKISLNSAKSIKIKSLSSTILINSVENFEYSTLFINNSTILTEIQCNKKIKFASIETDNIVPLINFECDKLKLYLNDNNDYRIHRISETAPNLFCGKIKIVEIEILKFCKFEDGREVYGKYSFIYTILNNPSIRKMDMTEMRLDIELIE